MSLRVIGTFPAFRCRSPCSLNTNPLFIKEYHIVDSPLSVLSTWAYPFPLVVKSAFCRKLLRNCVQSFVMTRVSQLSFLWNTAREILKRWLRHGTVETFLTAIASSSYWCVYDQSFTLTNNSVKDSKFVEKPSPWGVCYTCNVREGFPAWIFNVQRCLDVFLHSTFKTLSIYSLDLRVTRCFCSLSQRFCVPLYMLSLISFRQPYFACLENYYWYSGSWFAVHPRLYCLTVWQSMNKTFSCLTFWTYNCLTDHLDKFD